MSANCSRADRHDMIRERSALLLTKQVSRAHTSEKRSTRSYSPETSSILRLAAQSRCISLKSLSSIRNWIDRIKGREVRHRIQPQFQNTPDLRSGTWSFSNSNSSKTKSSQEAASSLHSVLSTAFTPSPCFPNRISTKAK